MSTLFLILLILALYHFIWESIILPHYRLKLRYKLFSLRDDLIQLKYHHPNEICNDTFHLLEDKINVTINRLPFFSISSLIDAKRYFDSNEKLRDEISKRQEILKKCKIEGVHKINEKLIGIGTKAFIFNTGGWLYILFPITLLVVLISLLAGSLNMLKVSLRNQVYKVIYTSDKEYDNMQHSWI